eukprot:g7821.t1
MPKPGTKKAAAAPKAAKDKKDATEKAGKGEKKTAKVEKDPVRAKIVKLQAVIDILPVLDISVKNLLSSGVQHSLVDAVEDRHEFQHSMVKLVGKALYDAATYLKQRTAHCKRFAEAAVETNEPYEASIAQIEAKITAKKTVLDTVKEEANRDIDALCDAEEKLEAHKKSLRVLVKTIGSKTAAVTDVTEKKESVFKPLLETPPESGKEDEHAVEQVKQLLKKVGATDYMLNAVVSALMATDRQEFDQVILQGCSVQLDTFVQKTKAEVAKLEASKTTIEGKIEEAKSTPLAARSHLPKKSSPNPATAAFEAAKATTDRSHEKSDEAARHLDQLMRMKEDETNTLRCGKWFVGAAEADRQEAIIAEVQFRKVLNDFEELKNRSATVPTDTYEDAKDVEMEDAAEEDEEQELASDEDFDAEEDTEDEEEEEYEEEEEDAKDVEMEDAVGEADGKVE